MNIKLSKDEELLNSVKLTTNLLLAWLKTDFSLTNKRIISTKPNTVLGLFPLGKDEISYPLQNIASVAVSTKFHLSKFIFGFLFLIITLNLGYQLTAFICFAISLVLLFNSFTSKMIVVNNAGQLVHVEISILEKSKVDYFVSSLNEGLSRLPKRIK